VQGYQLRVTKLQDLTGLRFGRLAAPSVDVLARQQAGRRGSWARGEDVPAMSVLERVADLVVA
jgi:hypothetical protein